MTEQTLETRTKLEEIIREIALSNPETRLTYLMHLSRRIECYVDLLAECSFRTHYAGNDVNYGYNVWEMEGMEGKDDRGVKQKMLENLCEAGLIEAKYQVMTEGSLKVLEKDSERIVKSEKLNGVYNSYTITAKGQKLLDAHRQAKGIVTVKTDRQARQEAPVSGAGVIPPYNIKYNKHIELPPR